MLEVNADYLVMFHDDDVMKPRFLVTLFTLISQNSIVAAVGCNASYLRNSVNTNETFLKPGLESIVIDSKEKLLDRYFLIGSQGISPFPGYMYRVMKTVDLGPDEDKGGIHADVSFLFDILARGPIVWTPEILMSYRLHESNLDKQSKVSIKLKLLRYLNSHIPKKRCQALRDFHYTIMLEWFRRQNLNILRYSQWSHRQQVVFKYIFGEILRHLFLRPECRSLHLRVLYEKASRVVAL